MSRASGADDRLLSSATPELRDKSDRPRKAMVCPTSILLILLAGFAGGVMYLFGIQFAAGDVYPEYSSLRTDPAGTKLLFDSLARLPGVTTARNYLPLDVLGENSGAVFLLGLNPGSFGEDDEGLQRIERLARRGNRVIAAMAAPEEYKELMALALDRAWHVRFGADSNRKHVHKLYFTMAKDWNVLDRVGEKMLAIERDFGKGSVVLFAESDDFTNGSTVVADRLEMVSMAIGASSRIVFDEQHLGIAESGSFVGLARRFRLTGLALGLGICAALFLWRSASGFPPTAGARDVPLSGRTSFAGLLTLLRRHVPPGELASTCWQEWLSANRRTLAPERLERAAAIAGRAPNRPLEAMREMHAVLSKKETQT
ncbi:MAG: hypothetical protein LAQ69_28440 [Acidobacteriia bacterium]|nr:hypothetical protein [Terriglobia bacterium]